MAGTCHHALIGDLIRGYYGSVSEQDGALESLGVDPGSDCQVLTIEYATATKDDALLYTNVENRIRWTIQSAYPDVLFYVAPNYVHFVMTGKGPGKISLPVERIGGYIRRVFNEESVQDSLHFFGGVSARRSCDAGCRARCRADRRRSAALPTPRHAA